MKIIHGTEPIDVDHPVFTIFGEPGVGKSSVGYSAQDPLTLDADDGAHRAANRRDTLVVATDADVVELLANPAALEPYSTIVIDTVGRLLDKMSIAIMDEDPKHRTKGGAMSITGWGVLKTRFRQRITQLRTFGKDVVLLAHDSEEKDGDTLINRPDIAGGSYDEVMKISDFVGYLSVVGKHRVLDFSPTEKHPGKNPAQWEPFILPPIEKAANVLAQIIEKGKAALGGISAESAAILQAVETWKADVAKLETPSAINTAVGLTKTMPPMQAAQAKPLLMERAKALGFVWDLKLAAFVDPKPVEAEHKPKGKKGEPAQESLEV